jgi:hypothetical protein
MFFFNFAVFLFFFVGGSKKLPKLVEPDIPLLVSGLSAGESLHFTKTKNKMGKII